MTERLGVFLLLPPVPIYIFGLKEALCLAKEHNTVYRSGLEHGPLNPGTCHWGRRDSYITQRRVEIHPFASCYRPQETIRYVRRAISFLFRFNFTLQLKTGPSKENILTISAKRYELHKYHTKRNQATVARFIRHISTVSNAIQTKDNKENHVIIYCLNCIRHGRNATYEPRLWDSSRYRDKIFSTSCKIKFRP